MIDKVVAQLKTGVIKAVVPFGARDLPPAPYIVVKEEPAPDLGYTRFRVIYHALPGQILPMRTYVRKDLMTLLDDKTLTGTGGNVNVIESLGEIGPTVMSNDDGTISQERTFRIWDLF